MKNKVLILSLISANVFSVLVSAQVITSDYPCAEISNDQVRMKLYLPDTINGYYRATRFEWSGIIASLEYDGHQYFGEWKNVHDPFFHEDLCGPVEGSVNPGLGYREAKTGGHFVRIGVGVLEKPEEAEYRWDHTYEILNHGQWKIEKGGDWIEFTHVLKSDIGYGYTYIKRIELKKEKPGFTITHTLKNTGAKKIEADQFNHNFFVIDGQTSGPDFVTTFPFRVSTPDDLKDLVKIRNNKLLFNRELHQESIWLLIEGYKPDIKDHNVFVRNRKTGAGIQFSVDKPLYRLAFWATTTTLCPENFIFISLDPGNEEKWTSDYTLYSFKKIPER
jgi:hypothetical protein